ncbi:MAG: hypothetical protein ACE5F1_06970, partial [Planctomycetota bacterium]
MRTLFRSILVFCGCVVVSGGVWRLLLSADDPSMPIGVEAKARSWRDGSLTPAREPSGRPVRGA